MRVRCGRQWSAALSRDSGVNFAANLRPPPRSTVHSAALSALGMGRWEKPRGRSWQGPHPSALRMGSKGGLLSCFF